MIRLCKDSAILGNRLLDEVNQLTSSETAQNKQGKFVGEFDSDFVKILPPILGS